jgi:Trehalase-like, N-terminal
MTLRIEDYALIGDCKTAALVGRDGSIDWLCWPRFDSAACFAALLGNADNGRWLIAPKDSPLSARRRYRPGTLVLETEFQTETGSAAVIDFMPPADGSDLVRIVAGRSGRIAFKTELAARFNYGSTVPWVNRIDDGSINAIAGPERLLLRTPVALYGEDLRTIGEFAVEAGARRRTLNLALYNAPIDVQNAMALATAYGPRRLRAGSSDMKKGCYGKPPAGTLATNQSPYPNSLLTGKLTGNFADLGTCKHF